MSDVTALGLPYLEDTDTVAGVAAALQALAEKIDKNSGKVQVGSVNSGVLVAATAKTVAVVFPVAYPVGTTVSVVGCYDSTLGNVQIFLGVTDVTRLGFNMQFRRETGTASLAARWHAIGITP